MNRCIALLVCVRLAMYSCEAKTVVMVPPPLADDIIHHSIVAKALIDLGHNVSLCVPAYLMNSELVPYKEINIVRYGEKLGNVEALLLHRIQGVNRFWESLDVTNEIAAIVISFYIEIVETIFDDGDFITSLKDLKSDFFILESIPLSQMMVVLPYKLDVPFGVIGMYLDYHTTGIPHYPDAEPMIHENFGESKSFFLRYIDTFNILMYEVKKIISHVNIVHKMVPEKPYKDIDKIILQAEIFIIEQDHVLGYPKPSLPNTKLVGGMSVRDAKPLSGDLKTFVSNSSSGIIVVSVGGDDFELPSHIKVKMLDAFRLLDQNIVWKIKWSLDQHVNVLALKWIPRNDLLGSKKTKLFISYCSNNEQYEALYHSVPLLCLPFNRGELKNAIKISTKEFGLYADIRKITSEELAGMVKELVLVPKYKTNIQRASKLFKELYKVPSKEAAYWFDHVMKYGGEYMRSPYQKTLPHKHLLSLDNINIIYDNSIAILLAMIVILLTILVMF